MKEDLTNKEEEIKGIADGMSFEIDTNDLWANIEPQLPPVENSRKRPIWWMISSVLLGLILVGSIFIYTSNESSEIIEGTEPVIMTSKVEPTNEIVLNDENNDVDNISTTKNNSSHKIESSPKTLTQKHQTTYNERHILGKTDNSNTTATNKEINDNTTINQPSALSVSTNNIINKESSLLLNEAKNIILNESQEIKTTLANRSTIKGISSIKLIELELLEQLNSPSIPTPNIEPVKINRWKSFWQINTGVNMSNNRISFLDNEVLLDQQFAKEQILIGLSSSIQYGQENKNGWRYFVGLSHVRSTSRYSNFEETLIRTQETGVESKTIDEFGNESETLGQITVTSIIQNDIVWHRNHDYVNLEVGLGKRHSILGNLSLVTDGYIGYNLWSNHEGYFFEVDHPTITKFSNSQNHPYQNKGVDIGGKLGLEYDLGNFSIGLSGNYNHGLGAITKSNNYYQIKNSHYGVQLGVVYRP